jgi:hypothetical protein
MPCKWFPLPSLEDEDVALVREQDFSDIFERLRNENQPAANSGTVDR